VMFSYLYYSNRQRMFLIEKNLYQKKPFDLDSFSLFSGLILTGIGLSLVIFFLTKEGFSYGVLSGLIPLSIGLSMLAFFIIRLRLRNEK